MPLSYPRVSNFRWRLISWGAGMAVALSLWFNGFATIFDLQISNQHLQWFGTRFKPSPEIVLVVIDDASLQFMERKVGRWPWPRSLISQLVRASDSAEALGIDILFLEHDHIHPHDDAELADALRQNHHTALAGVFSDELMQETSSSENEGVFRSLIPYTGTHQFKVQKLFQQYLPPLRLFANAANHTGHVNFLPSQDRLLRSYSYALPTDKGYVPSLVIATLMARDSRSLKPESIPGAPPMMSPDTTELLFYHESFVKYSAVDILAENHTMIPPRWAEGRIVLLGVEAHGLHDLRATPLAGRTSGLEIHATALSNWLQRTWIRSFPTWGILLIASLFSAMPVLFWNSELPSMIFRWSLVLLGYLCLGVLAFHFMAFRIPWTVPCTGFLGTAGCMLIFFVRHERKLHRRIEELQKMKQMLGNMLLHDLRAPLNSLLMLMESIIPSHSENSKSRQRLTTAITEGNRLSAMLQSLLDIHRMEAGRLQLRCAFFDWNELTSEALTRFQLQANKMELTLENIPANDPAKIHADRDLLARVLANLIDNALNFTPPKTIITCESHIIESLPPSLLFRISNHGQTLDASLQERIFDSFEQGVQRGRREGHRGLGLGLSYCKLAIAAHGGNIRCISPVPGWTDGVRVEFRIPTQLHSESTIKPIHEPTA